MNNPLEGMKAVYMERVYEILSIDFDIKPSPVVYLKVPEDEKVGCFSDGIMPLSLSQVTPLLKFPDKDSDFWSYDILRDKTTGWISVLIHNGITWKQLRIKDKKWTGQDFVITDRTLLEDHKRLCSIYDSNATDHLDQETIDKLQLRIENA